MKLKKVNTLLIAFGLVNKKGHPYLRMALFGLVNKEDIRKVYILRRLPFQARFRHIYPSLSLSNYLKRE